MKKVDTLCRVRQILHFLFGISSVLFLGELVLLACTLVLTPVLYFFGGNFFYSLLQSVVEIFGLIMAVIIFYILKIIFRNSIFIVDSAISGNFFSQNNSEIIWDIFRKILYFSGVTFFIGIFLSIFDPVRYGPFSWLGCLSDLADSALCLGLVYLIAWLFGVGVQLQSEIDEVI